MGSNFSMHEETINQYDFFIEFENVVKYGHIRDRNMQGITLWFELDRTDLEQAPMLSCGADFPVS